jgi:hypothetical protein
VQKEGIKIRHGNGNRKKTDQVVIRNNETNLTVSAGDFDVLGGFGVQIIPVGKVLEIIGRFETELQREKKTDQKNVGNGHRPQVHPASWIHSQKFNEPLKRKKI